MIPGLSFFFAILSCYSCASRSFFPGPSFIFIFVDPYFQTFLFRPFFSSLFLQIYFSRAIFLDLLFQAFLVRSIFTNIFFSVHSSRHLFSDYSSILLYFFLQIFLFFQIYLQEKQNAESRKENSKTTTSLKKLELSQEPNHFGQFAASP